MSHIRIVSELQHDRIILEDALAAGICLERAEGRGRGSGAQARVVHQRPGQNVGGGDVTYFTFEVPSHVEHELGLACELLPAHETQVMRMRVLPLRGVVCVAVGKVRSAATATSTLVHHRRGRHRRGGYTVSIQYLLVLIMMVQQL